MGTEAKAERVAAAPAPADSKASDELFAKLKEKVAPPVAEAKGEDKPDEPKLNYVQRQEKRIKERQERLAAAAEAKAAEEAKYADTESKYDAGRWSNAQGGWDTSQWDSTNYDTAAYEQSQYEGYDQSQYASQYDDGTQYTYDEGTQYHASQYEGGDPSHYDQSHGYDQSVYTEAIPEEGQYTEGYGHETIYTAPVAEEPSAFGGDASVYSAAYTADPSEYAEEPAQLEASTEQRLSTYSEEPQQVELGPRCPDAYTGYFDTVRQEPYAYDEATGECVYALDSDGAVFEADYRQVLWVRPYESSSIVAAPPERRPRTPSTQMVEYEEERAALIVQAAVRRGQAWARACEKAISLYVKKLDEETAFYAYELVDGDTAKPPDEFKEVYRVSALCPQIPDDALRKALTIEPSQWHRPAVLLGTRRRRGLIPYGKDCPDHSSDLAMYDDHSEIVSPQNDEEVDRYAWRVPMEPALMLKGPFCARTGRGKTCRFAINKLPDSKGLRNHHSVDQKVPLFLDNDEIECSEWKLGDWVQCFDGMVLKKVMVEPYMLSRGAGAQGPTEVVKLMQKNLKRPTVLYFCLMSIAKMELRESEMGLATKEASACVLQTLKTLTRYPKNEPLVAAATGALVQLAQNYATREVILKEEWQRLVVNALNNLKKESKEHLITTVDGQEKITVHTATRWARDTAMNGCRLFGVFAADPKRREDFAEEAIKACLVVLAFCDESATVCSAACDCLYNYCYRCEFAALLAAEQGAYEKVQEAVGNFMSDEHCQKQCERAIKVLAPNGWRGEEVT
jgi:hypothetical protein